MTFSMAMTFVTGPLPRWSHRPKARSHAPITPNLSFGFSREIIGDLCWEIDVGPPLFTFLQPEVLTDGTKNGWCDQPLNLTLLSHYMLEPIWLWTYYKSGNVVMVSSCYLFWLKWCWLGVGHKDKLKKQMWGHLRQPPDLVTWRLLSQTLETYRPNSPYKYVTRNLFDKILTLVTNKKDKWRRRSCLHSSQIHRNKHLQPARPWYLIGY